MRIKKIAAGLLALLAMASSCARAEAVSLPAGLSVIGAEAFAGTSLAGRIDIPEGVAAVSSGAFRDCAGIEKVFFPDSVTFIADGVLEGCPADVLIEGSAGGAACAYAQNNGFDYRCDTVCRALLIGQTYQKVPSLRLTGPINDLQEMNACLPRFEGTPYDVTTCENLTAEGILSAIDTAFGEALAQDISLFYYSGHGTTPQGSLLGSDGKGSVTADALRSALDQVPGRKIVIIDACYSGNMLRASSGAVTGPEAFVTGFISAFSRRTRSSLAADGYFVLTACAYDEVSYEGEVDGRNMGFFTHQLVESIGRPGADMPADANGNGVITFQELYNCVRDGVENIGQHVQAYPEDCGWFGVIRTD